MEDNNINLIIKSDIKHTPPITSGIKTRSYYSGNNVIKELALLNECKTTEINYYENYTLKQLTHIAKYYQLNRPRRKLQLCKQLALYETDITNYAIVFKRKKMWHYLHKIKEDNYLKKYLIFD